MTSRIPTDIARQNLLEFTPSVLIRILLVLKSLPLLWTIFGFYATEYLEITKRPSPAPPNFLDPFLR